MKLVKLTDSYGEDVYINIAQVITVRRTNNGTYIHTTGLKDGEPYRIWVSEDVENVVREMRRLCSSS